MRSFVEQKIDEVYNVALKLGVEGATDMEKDIFKKALRHIAVAAIDEVRGNIAELMHNESNKYTNAKAETICPDCNGAGQLTTTHEFVHCKRCNGSGKI